MTTAPDPLEYDWLLDRALREDRADQDVTTTSVVPPRCRGTARIVAKESGILCGLPVMERLVGKATAGSELSHEAVDGDAVEPGDVVATVSGGVYAILCVERTILNFMQRLSGVATLTSRFVRAVEGTDTHMLDTRKTTPGWRALEKYAVRCGGGHNHRMNLSDEVLIKENHLHCLDASGPEAVKIAVQKAWAGTDEGMVIEVEVETLEELDAALEAEAHILLLDNMSVEQVAEAVRRVREHRDGDEYPLSEASGDITLENAAEYARTGVDRISIGALTHSAPALDLSLQLEVERGG